MALNQLELSLQFGKFDNLAAHRALLTRSLVSKWIRHALAVDAEMTVRIVGTEEGQQLNREYRHKDYATNVLTFDYQQEPTVMADLVICGPVVEREAQEQNKTLEEHYAHLLVHAARPGLGPRNQRGRCRRDGGLRDRHHGRAGLRRPVRQIGTALRATQPRAPLLTAVHSSFRPIACTSCA